MRNKLIMMLISLFISTGLMAQAENNGVKDKKFVIELNPLNSIIFGPHFAGEFNVEGLSFGLGYAFVGKGLLLNSLSSSDASLEYSFSGYWVQPGLKYYFNHAEKGMDSFYLGVSIVFFKFSVEEKNASTLITKKDDFKLTIPLLEIGWRWIWDSGFTLRFGFQGGFISSATASGTSLSAEDKNDVEKISGTPIGGIEFTLGFAF